MADINIQNQKPMKIYSFEWIQWVGTKIWSDDLRNYVQTFYQTNIRQNCAQTTQLTKYWQETV